MKLRKRFIVNLLTVVLAVSSIQFPTVTVQAQELYQEVEEINGVTADEDAALEVQEAEFDTEEADEQEEDFDTEDTYEQERDSGIEDTDKLTEDSTDQDYIDDSGNFDETDSGENLGNEDSASEVSGGDSWEAEDETENQQSILETYEDNIASGTYQEGDSNVTWVIDRNGKLTVEGTGDFYSGDYGSAPWYNYRTSIISAEINMTGMTNISNMFTGCSNLVSLDVSGLNTGSVTHMNRVFVGCSSLLELDISGFDTANVTDMGYMFSGCSSLTELDLSTFDVSKLIFKPNMFSGCKSLSKIRTPYNLHFLTPLPVEAGEIWKQPDGVEITYLPQDLDYSIEIVRAEKIIIPGENIASGSYEDINWVIDENGKLTVVGTGNFAVQGYDQDRIPWSVYRTFIKSAEINVKDMTNASYMFYECSSLTDIDLSGFNTDNVTDMSYMFYGCNSLTNLDLSKFNTSRVTTMSYMFYDCRNLTRLDLSGFDTSQVVYMNWMFFDCASLKNLDLRNFNTSKVKGMDWMFAHCSKLESLDVSSFDTSKLTRLYDTFVACSSLTSLDVSDFNTSNVTYMSGVFAGCSNLTSLDVSSFDTSKVTNMYAMFAQCSSLTSLDVSGFNTENVLVMERMFDGCSGLEELDLSSFDAGNVTDMSDMLSGCTNLKLICTPLNVSLEYSVMLPKSQETDVWYRSDTGDVVTELPQGLSYSILLAKNEIPNLPRLSVTKIKTAYQCGEAIGLEDLTINYYDQAGVRAEITEGYNTNVQDIDVNIPGKKILEISYEGLKAEVELTFTYFLTEESISIQMSQDSIYNGLPQTPNLTLTIHMDGTDKASQTDRTLIPGTDYTVSYTNNINAGEKAEAIITGIGDYSGTVKKNFIIVKATLIITANDLILSIGDSLPADEDYKYQLTGLVIGDELLKEPSFTCEITDITQYGTYPIIPSGADAGPNYEIVYQNGTLTIAEEKVIYTVTFDLLGHGAGIAPIAGIKAGSLISEPEALKEGSRVTEENISYIFTGWYKDQTFAAKQKWNFDTDTVQEDTTLYACWLIAAAEGQSGLQLCIQDIRSQTYTGSAVKPNVTVYDSDGVTLLKSGKDYTIKYAKNTNAVLAGEDGKLPEIGTASVTTFTNADGKKETQITSIAGTFNKELPYVIIAGKGNYKETIYKNFYILPVEIASEDEGGNVTLASGFALKYTDQMAISISKAQKPFSSLKYKKAMKAGTDYEVKLSALDAYDAKGNPAQNADREAWAVTGSAADKYIPAIPKGYYGTFIMTVTGNGNYSGSFTKTIIVSDKSHLLKNVSVSIGKDIKTQKYNNGKELTLTPGYYDKTAKEYYKFTDKNGSKELVGDAKGIYTVKAGSDYLVYGKDYSVSYTNNKAVGTATMTITGMGEYMGSKSVTFNITGETFSEKTIDVKEYDKDKPNENDWKISMSYTGVAMTQNKVTLTPKKTDSNLEPAALIYGTHYTITYKNNLKKGTATMIFTAKPESGYSGSFKKTFKITAQSLLDVKFGEENSVKDENSDKNKNSKTMKWNGDVPTYSKNGAVLTFTLKNADGMEMRQGTDYTVSYTNNKAVTDSSTRNLPTLTIRGKGNYAGTLTVTFPIQQADIAAVWEEGTLTVSAASVARKDNMKFTDFKLKVLDGKKALSEGEGKDYLLTECTDATIQDYADALAQKKETADLEPKVTIKGTGINYTGEKTVSLAEYIYVTKFTSKNLKIEVTGDTAYIGSDVKIEPSVKVTYYPNNDAGTTDAVSVPLTEADYSLIYGANNMAGKNKGSVTVIGTGIYGGNVTVKFTIQSKNIYSAIN